MSSKRWITSPHAVLVCSSGWGKIFLGKDYVVCLVFTCYLRQERYITTPSTHTLAQLKHLHPLSLFLSSPFLCLSLSLCLFLSLPLSLSLPPLSLSLWVSLPLSLWVSPPPSVFTLSLSESLSMIFLSDSLRLFLLTKFYYLEMYFQTRHRIS